MIRASVQTPVLPGFVWAAFRTTFSLEGGREGRFKYRVLSVREGESFTLLWKALFARLVFTYSVVPHPMGSEIATAVEIRGLFAPLVRILLKKKIQESLELSLNELVKKLAKHC